MEPGLGTMEGELGGRGLGGDLSLPAPRIPRILNSRLGHLGP